VLTTFLGPLAGTESRRSLSRKWVFVVRALATLPPAIVLVIALWHWWFSAKFVIGYSPLGTLQIGLASLEWMLITVGLVLAPALLAGSLAGEKARNTLGLLLACLVSHREIVIARLAGRLSVVGVVFLSVFPPFIFLCSLLTLPLAVLGTLIQLPLAIAIGGGGLAIGASAVARRGRDALFAAYLLVLLNLLVPAFSRQLPAGAGGWLAPLFPYHGVLELVENTDPVPAQMTAWFWCFLGLAGAAWASWRLRPAYLSDAEKRPRRWFVFSRTPVPRIGMRPILWKELYIERLRSFNPFVRWLAIFIVVVFCGTSLALAGIYFLATFVRPYPDVANWAEGQLSGVMHGSWTISWLLQWTMGLRAAVAIASERERQTWDGLLLCPLEGGEIVLGKIWGSLYSLRWFAAAILLAWTAGVSTGALSVIDYLTWVADTLFIGIFMVAAGVYFSLSCASSTRAMTLTVVSWMGAIIVAFIVAGLLAGIAYLAVILLELLLMGPNFVPSGIIGPGGANLAAAVYAAGKLIFYALAAVLITLYCRRNFDRLAGRSFDAPQSRPRRRKTAPKPAQLSPPSAACDAGF
jgi:ABC-type transport system involved in multi-copper enzyme maturation permease subunit